MKWPGGWASLARLVELFDECRERRRDGRRERVILVPKRFPNRVKPNVSVAGAIHVAWSVTGNDMPAYPAVDSISCDGEVKHYLTPLS
jgi:hypothetical protein